ncbi:hypothetical protein ACP4OV_005872 [Aristida adscensionis]
MKIAWGKNAKAKRQPLVTLTKPDLPFGVESDTGDTEQEERAETNPNSTGTKPVGTAESLQQEGNKLAEGATELDPLWPEAWVTLGRAKLNFGEPDSAISSFDKALALKPDLDDAKADRETAARLVRKREQLHSSGLSANKRRFTVGENSEKGAEGEEKGEEASV